MKHFRSFIKQFLKSRPMLAHIDEGVEPDIHDDVSSLGLGALLLQRKEAVESKRQLSLDLKRIPRHHWNYQEIPPFPTRQALQSGKRPPCLILAGQVKGSFRSPSTMESQPPGNRHHRGLCPDGSILMPTTCRTPLLTCRCEAH